MIVKQGVEKPMGRLPPKARVAIERNDAQITSGLSARIATYNFMLMGLYLFQG